MRVERFPDRIEYTGKAKEIALVIEDVLRGRTDTRIARERNLTESVVAAIRIAHGHPKANALRAAVVQLAVLGDQSVTFVGGPPATQPETAPDPSTKASPAMPDQTSPVPARPTGPGQSLSVPSTLPAAAGSIEQLIAKARQHDVTRIKRLGEKIADLVDELNEALVADAEDAKRRARIAELKAELAQLQGAPAASSHPCTADGCGKTFPSKQGLATHTTRVHGKKAA